MRSAFSPILFVLICSHFLTGYAAKEADASSPPTKYRSRFSTVSPVEMDDTSLGGKIENIRKILGIWVVENEIPVGKLLLLDDKPRFSFIQENLREPMLSELLVTLEFPIPSEDVIDAFQQWVLLPVVPIFTSLIDDCLSPINKDTPEAEISELLRFFAYR
ncbi:MAG: hypothetical protein FJX18_01395 [Alphaproteobacteria bacterium]|nr:hypothetical protein [Alphaproteobacteria bacterium]